MEFRLQAVMIIIQIVSINKVVFLLGQNHFKLQICCMFLYDY